VADIFVSYTSKDRDWAEWIGQELEELGHVAHLDAWEISGGGNIMAWMEERHDNADGVLCVVSGRYFERPYSALERQGAQWAAASRRPNFLLPVFIEPCEPPTLLAPLKRCELYGVGEDDARARLATFMAPAAKPVGPVPFPGVSKPSAVTAAAPVAFPGGPRALSNIPIHVPRHFLGRDNNLAAIDGALNSNNGRAAITALHGLRGVGKTTLAAAQAERHSSKYRATWWIRAETESTMRADLVGLGVRMDWVAPDAQEEPAFKIVMDRLRDDGDGILLIYDNANSAREFEKYAPRGGAAHVIVTSNAPDWRGIAAPIAIEVWPSGVGADFLIERTGRTEERAAAVALSEALGGLPLAHEQAAAFCERLGISLFDYTSRFAAEPGKYLGDERAAPAQYHDGLTVSKTFAIAIDEAAKLHPAAEPLIVYASLLAPEPIPLYFFSEAREEFAEPLSSLMKGDGLDEAVGALRAFALVDRESIPDEREPSITTDCIRLHRLVRQVAAARQEPAAHVSMRGELVEAMAATYPSSVYNEPAAWLKVRRLDAIALALVDGAISGSAAHAHVLTKLAAYREGALAAYADARPYYERAIGIYEKARGPDHPHTATSLNNLGHLLVSQGDLAGARPYYERALAIYGKALGPDHPHTATSLNNLATLLQSQGDLAGARPYHERALAIREKALGPDHPDTANSLNNLAGLLQSQGDLTGARPYYERALAIREKALGPNHPGTARSLNNLAGLLESQGDLAGARPCYERALTITEKALGPDHPDTARSLNNLASLLRSQGDLVGALPYSERALDVCERKLGLAHPDTRTVATNVAVLLYQLKLPNQAAAIREKFGLKDVE
jgi:tetratricopeptide (TPR) repeat protein